jgi:hypothetical protein
MPDLVKPVYFQVYLGKTITSRTELAGRAVNEYGRGITTDNCFTGFSLAEELLTPTEAESGCETNFNGTSNSRYRLEVPSYQVMLLLSFEEKEVPSTMILLFYKTILVEFRKW